MECKLYSVVAGENSMSQALTKSPGASCLKQLVSAKH